MQVEVRWATLAAAEHGLRALLDATELARIDRLDRAADRGRILLGAALLRTAASDRLGLHPASVRIDRTCEACGEQHGAPRLLHAHAPFASVSHSGLLVAVALAEAPLGIDVQRIADLPAGDDPRDWVRRESATKARGTAAAAGVPPRPLALHDLDAPLGGYAAALALPAAVGVPVLRLRGP